MVTQLTMKKAKRPDRPKLLIAMYGASMAGKSKLTATLPGSILLFDAGGRFMDQAAHRDDVFEVYETAKENSQIQKVTAALAQVMPNGKDEIENIVYDDFTFAFQTLVEEVEGMPTSGTGSRETRNYKAKTMKALRRELFGYKKNVIIIYHTHKAGDGVSDKITEKKTLSDVEISRTNMFTNMTLLVVVDPQTGRHGVTVERNRFGHSGFTVWDESGTWKGFWEKLQEEAYKGLSWDDMMNIAAATPTTFADEPAAWSWGAEQGCFRDVAHAANAFKKIQRENDSTGDELWALWVDDVLRRKREVDSTTFADGEQAISWGVDAFGTIEASRAAYVALKAEKRPANARAMFALWIGLVHSLIDAEPAAPETPEEPEPAPVVVEATATAPAPTEAPTVVVAQQPDVEPIVWMRQNLPSEAQAYVEQVLAATDSKKASAAQIASLRVALAEAAFWNGDADDKLHGVTKIEWLANILAGRTGGDLAAYPAGAFKVIGGAIIKEMSGKVNSSYSPERAALVRQVAEVIDAAYQVYATT